MLGLSWKMEYHPGPISKTQDRSIKRRKNNKKVWCDSRRERGIRNSSPATSAAGDVSVRRRRRAGFLCLGAPARTPHRRAAQLPPLALQASHQGTASPPLFLASPRLASLLTVSLRLLAGGADLVRLPQRQPRRSVHARHPFLPRLRPL